MSLQNSLANYSFLTLLISVIVVWFETLIPKTNNSKYTHLKNKSTTEETQDLNLNLGSFSANTTKSELVLGISSSLSIDSAKPGVPGVDGVNANKPNSSSGTSMLFLNYVEGQPKLLFNKFNFSLLKNNTFAMILVLISNILLSLLLIVRWKESGHFPLSNLYESLMFLSWCFTAFYIRVYSTGLLKNKKASELMQKMVGCVAIPCALLCNAFASFTLPKEMQEASPLVPALQSNWLMMHVSVMILSYAALILGSLMSIAFLIVSNSNFLNSKNLKETNLLKTETYIKESQNNNNNMLVQESNIQNNNEKIALMLDNLSYRILALGFPLLTIGILSGAVWANEAWGSYWSWDPKETWALLTWLVFAVYLHTRLSKGWQGKKPAVIASFGFFVVWMCYLGVNLIGEGLHSYGWIVKS